METKIQYGSRELKVLKTYDTVIVGGGSAGSSAAVSYTHLDVYKRQVASLMNNPEYGVEFFEKLKEHGAELESGTTSTHTKVAAAAYKEAIGVDYVTQSLADKGSTIRFTYPEKDLIAVSSPIALLKDSPNPEGGKALYDYIPVSYTHLWIVIRLHVL